MNDFFKSIEILETDISDEKYYSNSDFISASGLKVLKQSPLHFKEQEKETTEAMVFGSAYHLYILEPEKFDAKYFVLDEKEILEILISEGAKSPRATNKYKEWYFQQETLSAGRIILDMGTKQIIDAMKTRIFSHRYAKHLCTDGEAEKSILVKANLVDDTSVLIKLKPDLINWKKKVIIDLKTTSDASALGFPKYAGEFDYHIQAALYTDIIEMITGDGMSWQFIFVAQEKKKPFAFNMFEASPQFLGQGRYEYQQLIKLWQWCKWNNKWPGYQCFVESKYGILDLNLPNWFVKEINWFIH